MRELVTLEAIRWKINLRPQELSGKSWALSSPFLKILDNVMSIVTNGFAVLASPFTGDTCLRNSACNNARTRVRYYFIHVISNQISDPSLGSKKSKVAKKVEFFWISFVTFKKVTAYFRSGKLILQVEFGKLTFLNLGWEHHSKPEKEIPYRPRKNFHTESIFLAKIINENQLIIFLILWPDVYDYSATSKVVKNWLNFFAIDLDVKVKSPESNWLSHHCF